MRNKKKYAGLMMVMCIWAGISTAQHVIIKCYAPHHKRQELVVSAYADQITYTERVLGKAVVNDSSDTEIKIPIRNNVECLMLRIGVQKSNVLYAEPGKTYQLLFPAPDTINYPNKNVDQPASLTIIGKDTSDLNSLIIDYNRTFDTYWSYPLKKNFVHKERTFTDTAYVDRHVHRKINPQTLDSFRLLVKQKYGAVKHEYFHVYVEYNLAMFQERTLMVTRSKLPQKLILPKPIYYTNYAYMEYFNAVFKQHLQQFAYSPKGFDVFTFINDSLSYSGLYKILEKDKMLRTDSLKELILLKGLMELYYVRDFNRMNVLQLIDSVRMYSKIPIHQEIAVNVLGSFSKLKPGSPAPDFDLIDRFGYSHKLSDYRGRYVYIDFWSPTCVPCLQEMKIMAEMKKEYCSTIEFISIAVDCDYEEMKKMLAKNPKYNWHFLYYGGDPKLKQNYEIYALPTYYFIDPNGNILYSPALRPSENIAARIFAPLHDNRKPIHRVGAKENPKLAPCEARD